MTVELDPFRSLRNPLIEKVRAMIDTLPYSQTELLHQQISRVETQVSSSSQWLPALACLATAEALGAPQRQALAAAAAIALLEATAGLIHELVDSEADPKLDVDSLILPWGKPRILNAADGYFALAHAAILDLPGEGVDVEDTFTITNLFDQGCAAWCEEAMSDLTKDTRHPGSSAELLRLGVELSAGLAGLSTAEAATVAGFVAVTSRGSLSNIDVSPDVKKTLEALAIQVGDSAKN